MEIWEYKATAEPSPSKVAVALNDSLQGGLFIEKKVVFALPSQCPYCASRCCLLDKIHKVTGSLGSVQTTTLAELHVCDRCGWWTIAALKQDEEDETCTSHFGQFNGELVSYGDIGMGHTIEELRRYLLASYDARYDINPRKMEEVVEGVFKDMGYTTLLTSASRDNGIDIYLVSNDSGETAAVQVKRYKDKISPELIRSFAGALLLNGETKGIFVTTSTFTSDARRTAQEYVKRAEYKIELMDASRLYDVLGIGLRAMYDNGADRSTPFYSLWKDPEVLCSRFHECNERPVL